jgi:hypothetical protein
MRNLGSRVLFVPAHKYPAEKPRANAGNQRGDENSDAFHFSHPEKQKSLSLQGRKGFRGTTLLGFQVQGFKFKVTSCLQP